MTFERGMLDRLCEKIVFYSENQRSCKFCRLKSGRNILSSFQMIIGPLDTKKTPKKHQKTN